MSQEHQESDGEARPRRALVTGATGCIGRCLVRRLVEQGWSVNALVRDPRAFKEECGKLKANGVRAIRGDLADVSSLDDATEGVEAIFHAAGKAHVDPRSPREEADFSAVNVTGTENLLRAGKKHGARTFIFFSTIGVYGPGAAGLLREKMPCRPQGAYARSKCEAEQRVAELADSGGTRATVLRLSLVYGEGDRGNFLRMVQGIDAGRFFYVGNGESRKSMTYVENVADAALLAAGKLLGRCEIFNVSDPSPYPLRLVVETISKQLGVPTPKRHVPTSVMNVSGRLLESVGRLLRFRPPFTAADVRRLTTDAICDVSKIRETLGFQAGIGLAEGVARTVRWYRDEQAKQPEGS